MWAAAPLYIRQPKQPYTKVEFKTGKPVLPKDYEGIFYLRLSENGKRRWKPFRSLDAALTQQANIETNLDRARKGIPPLVVAEPVTDKGTIVAAVAEFIAYSESRENDWRNGADNGLAPNSVVAYRKSVQDFAASCAQFGAVQMSEFQNFARGEAILLNFKNWLRENVTRKKGKGAYSDAKKFTVLGQFLARNGLKLKMDRTFNPNDVGLVDNADVPRVKKPGIADVVFYTPEDIKAMLAACDSVHEKSNYLADDLKDLVFILLCTGLRDEEVQHLCWSDIHWANGDGKMKITVQDKPTWERNSQELLFSTSQGTPDQNFAKRITSVQKRAEAKGYVFSRPETHAHIIHNFRKSYGTYQMLQGVPARNLQRDLGHSELATTERYLAIVEEPARVRKAYEGIK
jgi:integrase